VSEYTEKFVTNRQNHKENRHMADNKRKTGKADRSKVSRSEGYEVSYFARKHGITAEQTRKLIDKVGNDRAKLNKAAEKLKKK
jgi:hypothetical protein